MRPDRPTQWGAADPAPGAGADPAQCFAPSPASSAGAEAPGRIRHRFPACPMAVRDLLERAAANPALAHRFDDRAELVLAEALNNVVEHACAHRPDAMIEVTLEWRAAALTCRIVDEGAEMPGGLPGVTDTPRAEDLPEGGFGWCLIHALACDLRYTRARNRNCLEFTIPAAP